MKKLNREELLDLVRNICLCNYESEEECQELLQKVRDNVLMPDISNLIFKHDPELTAEEIVEKALSYKPIITAPPPKRKEEKK